MSILINNLICDVYTQQFLSSIPQFITDLPATDFADEVIVFKKLKIPASITCFVQIKNEYTAINLFEHIYYA